MQYKMQEGNNYNLTLREIEVLKKLGEVLKKLGEGLNNYQIAKELFISENTVKKHVSQILAKLNLQDRTQAALYANNIEK